MQDKFVSGTHWSEDYEPNDQPDALLTPPLRDIKPRREPVLPLARSATYEVDLRSLSQPDRSQIAAMLRLMADVVEHGGDAPDAALSTATIRKALRRANVAQLGIKPKPQDGAGTAS